MFEEAQQLGSAERKIVLQTRLGHSIDNRVEVDPPPDYSVNRYRLLVNTYGKGWKQRKPPTGIYNCAGHVWASRRTSIFDPKAWRRILEDDGYRLLTELESPWPGDIVLYLDQTAGSEILHVGRVYNLSEGVSEMSPRIPWVISKWDSASGESLHDAYDVHQYRRNFDLEVRFYTDRGEHRSIHE